MLIVDADITPRRTVYFTAATVLRTLREAATEVDLATLVAMLRRADAGVPMEAVVSGLDFLFLLGSVTLTKDGGIRCS